MANNQNQDPKVPTVSVGERWTDVVLAGPGWFAWFKEMNGKTLDTMIRRPLLGWGIISKFTVQANATKDGQPKETITNMFPLVLQTTDGRVTAVTVFDEGHTFIGVEWPGMTTQEKNVLIDQGLRGATS